MKLIKPSYGMSKKKGGYLVTYLKDDNTLQKALLSYMDQNAAFENKEKALLILLNNDLTPIKDESDKPKKVLKQLSLLTIIGYSD